ncbi:MAG: DUF4150 domain-containing protein [Minicystis sp.]
MGDNRAVNKCAEARVIGLTPDVCHTPMGSSLVRVPYTISATFEAAEATAPQVRYGGLPAFTVKSRLPKVQGNEPGTGGGVVSTVNEGYARPISHSQTVRAHQCWVVRHGDFMEMNCAGPEGRGNTVGRIAYGQITDVSAEDPAKTDPNTRSLEIRQSKRTDPKTGREIEETWSKKVDADGKVTESYTRVEMDPQTGSVETIEGTAITDPATGQTSLSMTRTAVDGSTGNLVSQTYSSTVPAGQFQGFPSGSLNGSTGPVLGSDAIGQVQPDGRMYVGDGMYADPRSVTPAGPAGPALPAGTDAAALAREQAAAQAEAEALQHDLAMLGVQVGLDVAGIFDPTGAADLASAGFALSQGDYFGATLSVVSAIPFGDILAKAPKEGRLALRIEQMTEKLAKLDAKLAKISKTLERVAAEEGKLVDDAAKLEKNVQHAAAEGEKAVDEIAEAKRAAAGGGHGGEPPPKGGGGKGSSEGGGGGGGEKPPGKDGGHVPRRQKKPKSGLSGKEAASDVPSWAKGNRPYVGEDGKTFAKRLCDNQFGKGNYDTGPRSPFNQIKKWGDRAFEDP